MRVWGRSSAKRAKHCNSSQVGKMISTARLSSGSQPCAKLPAAISSEPASSNSALAGRRQVSLAADHFEHLVPQQRLQLLHRVGHRGLTFVKIFSGLRVSAGIDDGQQGAPLVQRDLWGYGHLSIQLITSVQILVFSIQ